MPRPAAAPIPETCTTGQLARLLGKTERTIAGRKADGRLPAAPGGGIALALVVSAGVDAFANAQRRGGRMPLEEVSREAYGLATWAAECVVSAIAAPLPGETMPQAAARGLAHAVRDDDYFLLPPGWQPPEVVQPDPHLLAAEEEEAGAAAE